MTERTRPHSPGSDGRKGSLVLEGVNKMFGDFTALAAVDLEIPSGSFFGLLGPSGCGKTTLLRILAGLLTPTAGKVLLDGSDITRTPPERRPFNIVFQGYAMFPHLSVGDNVAFGLTTSRRARPSRTEIDERVHAMLDLVGLSEFGSRRPHQLSGGQQQRVALARALIKRPRLLLLDEPLAALDRNVRHALREELLRIHAELGTTFVFVTHDQEEALSMSDRVALMNHGLLEQVSDPVALYRRPATLFAARFIGAGTFLDGRVLGSDDGLAELEVGSARFRAQDAGLGTAEAATVLLRPEELSLAADEDNGRLDGTVITRAFFGSYYELQIETALGLVRVREAQPVRTGDRVRIDWPEVAGIAYPSADAGVSDSDPP